MNQLNKHPEKIRIFSNDEIDISNIDLDNLNVDTKPVPVKTVPMDDPMITQKANDAF